MPISYITGDPVAIDRDELNKRELELIHSNWAPLISPCLWLLSDEPKRIKHPKPVFVQACIQQLARAEVIILYSGWKDYELCRIEHQFAVDNKLIIKNGDEKLMEGAEFEEKYMKINIEHDYKHAHPETIRHECSF